MKTTTALDVLKFAWTLYRSPHRANLRIGQIVENSVHFNSRYGPLFYVENKNLRTLVRTYWW
jgi:hypothetical protein